MSNSKADSTVPRKNASGGSAAAGGMNLHARVAAVAAVYMLGGRRLGWLKGIAIDVPSDLWCETNGPGDDLRFTLNDRLTLEAQVKKGLSRGEDLWTALDDLVTGIQANEISYGALVVDIDASGTIRRGLARGIERIADGRTDDLDDIANEFRERLKTRGLTAQAICSRLRILVMHCADNDDASEQAAKTELRRLCTNENDVQSAWTTILIEAHSLIERRGRWTPDILRRLLLMAGVQTSENFVEAAPAAVSGCVWEQLERLSPSRGYIQTFRQHYLASEQSGLHAFGGREAEFEKMDAWLSNATGPGRMLLCAPTARGKSALLIQWTERLVSDHTWAVIFVPISLRFGTDRPAVFYAMLATQIAAVLNVKLAPPPTDPDAYYQGLSAALVAQAGETGKHVLIVLDGLDEAHNASFNATILSSVLPPNIKILVSAREQAGDRGTEGWIERLGWRGQVRFLATGLSILDRGSIAPILESVQLNKACVSHELIDRLWILSGGEPLLLSLYAEDLKTLEQQGEPVTVDTLSDMSPGFNAYFSRAFDVDNLVGDHDSQQVAEATLAVLAMAMSPIEGQHLADLVCGLTNIPRPITKDRFVRPIKRFVAGDGSRDHGYVLNHPKLGQYLREERFDKVFRNLVEVGIVDWGRKAAVGLASYPKAPVPAYILRHFVDHLLRAGTVSLGDIELLLTDDWRQAWFAVDRDYASYANSLIAATVAIPQCSEDLEIGRMLRIRLQIALRVGSVKSQGITMPSELLALSLDADLLTLQQALNVAYLQMPANLPGYLLAIASHLPPEAIAELNSTILQTENMENRFHQLAQLTQYLREPHRSETIGQVLAWIDAPEDVQPRLGVLMALAPALTNQQLEDVLTWLESASFESQHHHSTAITLGQFIGILHTRGLLEQEASVIQRCLSWVESVADTSLSVIAFRTIAPYLNGERLKHHLSRLTSLVEVRQQEMTALQTDTCDIGDELRQAHFMEARATLEIIKIREFPADEYIAHLQSALSPLLVPDYWSVNALLNIVPSLREDARQEIVKQVYQVAAGLSSANNRTYALMKLASDAAPSLRQEILARALFDARWIEDSYTVGMTLVALFSVLPLADKQRNLNGLLEDIQKIDFYLHRGSLFLQLSHQLPSAADLAGVGVSFVMAAQSTGNVVTVLRELCKLPEETRRSVFDQCWQLIVNSRSLHAHFQFAGAAEFACEYWTSEHLEIARLEVDRPGKNFRAREVHGLLPVAVRLGAQDLVDRIFELISLEENPAERVSLLARATKSMVLLEPHKKLLSLNWFLALESPQPQLRTLIDSVCLLSSSDQQRAWPELVALSKVSLAATDLLLSLSKLAKSEHEKLALFNAALQACVLGSSDQFLGGAVQAILGAPTTEARFRAFDLLATNSSITRDNVLSAVTQLAPVLAEVGSSSLVQELMTDIRECAAWWP